MIKLLTLITAKLKEAHPKVFLEQAPATTPFPYVVFNLPTSDENEGGEDFILEVDVWDKNSDTTTLETLSEAVDKKLNRFSYTDENLHASFWRINRLMLPDDDPTIRRRQLRYQVKVYFRQEVGE